MVVVVVVVVVVVGYIQLGPFVVDVGVKGLMEKICERYYRYDSISFEIGYRYSFVFVVVQHRNARA